MNKSKHWMGSDPKHCDICHKKIDDSFVDGATTLRLGSWANMCRHCFNAFGIGLGIGRGQRYDKQPDGRWLKID